MIKDFAWDLFKNTGNVDAYLMMREIETREGTIIKTKDDIKTSDYLGGTYGNNKN